MRLDHGRRDLDNRRHVVIKRDRIRAAILIVTTRTFIIICTYKRQFDELLLSSPTQRLPFTIVIMGLLCRLQCAVHLDVELHGISAWIKKQMLIAIYKTVLVIYCSD